MIITEFKVWSIYQTQFEMKSHFNANLISEFHRVDQCQCQLILWWSWLDCVYFMLAGGAVPGVATHLKQLKNERTRLNLDNDDDDNIFWERTKVRSDRVKSVNISKCQPHTAPHPRLSHVLTFELCYTRWGDWNSNAWLIDGTCLLW